MFFLFFVFLFLSLWLALTSVFAAVEFDRPSVLGCMNSTLITITVFFAAMAFNW